MILFSYFLCNNYFLPEAQFATEDGSKNINYNNSKNNKMTDSALIHNTSLQSNDSTARKLAVRLRLKKSNPQILQNPQSGPVSGVLHEQNNKLSKNTSKLADINIQELSSGLKDYMERIVEHYQNKYEIKKSVFCRMMKEFRKELRFLAMEAEQVLGKDAASCGRSTFNQSMPSNLQGSNLIGSQSLNNHTQKQPQLTQIQQKLPPKLSRQKQNIDDENKSMQHINKDLRGQISEMEHYIIRLKQLIDQKDNVILQLNKKVGKMGNEISDLKQKLDEKTKVCNILEEEVLGYENKLEQLQGKSQKKSKDKEKSIGESILSNSSYANEDPVKLTESMYSDVEQYKRIQKQLQQKQQPEQKQQNGEQVNKSQEQVKDEIVNSEIQDEDNQNILDDEDEDENEGVEIVDQDIDYDDQQARALKLEQIYSKTQQALKKCKIMSEEINTKQSQCSMLANKISIILSVIGIDQVEQVYMMQESDLMLMVNKHIQKKLQKIKQQYNDRESKFQTMISLQLDQALTSIQQQIPQQNQLEIQSHDTILDKIQKINQVVKYIMGMNSSGQYVDMLMIMYRKFQEIMRKSEEFKLDLTENNRILLRLCQGLEKNGQEQVENGEIGDELKDKLQTIQNLLKQNEQLLGINEGQPENQPAGKLTGMSTAQIQSYLEELQNVIKNIQKNQHKNHQKYKKQNEDLRQEIRQYLQFNNKTTTKIQQILKNLNRIQSSQQNIKSIQHQLSQLLNKIKSFNKKDTKWQVQLDEKTQEEVQNLKKKYFQDSPDFVDDIMSRLIKIKEDNSEQILGQVAESILNLIHTRDLRLKQQIGRKRQLLKQRTAAIAQMCKQGMRDSSFEGSMKKQ